jgi:hypothetical protein
MLLKCAKITTELHTILNFFPYNLVPENFYLGNMQLTC